MTEEFKPRVARRYTGTYRPRIDGGEKARGTAEFIDDIALKRRFPDILYAKVLRSPYAHARIKNIDLSKAEKLPGVKAILTYKDPEVASLKPTNAAWTDGTNTVSYKCMMWKNFRDRRVLSDHVCWVGDEAGVVVAAESEELAEEALRLIDIEWELLPFVLDPGEAMKPGAPVIHPEITPSSNVLPPDNFAGADVILERGDVEKAFAEANVVIEVASRYSNATHAVLDHWCCLAAWEDDKVTIWSNSYEADQTRMHVSEMLEIPLNKVRVICPYVGGQHGRGDTGDQPFFIFTALLAKKTGRPVKFKHTRRESFPSGRTRELQYCEIGGKKDGIITGVYLKLIGDSGGYAGHALAALKRIPRDYAECSLGHVPSLKMESYVVYTNKLPSSCMRSIGNIQVNFIMGLALDTLAEKLGIDPIELALKNIGNKWAPLPNKSLEAILRVGARKIGWEKRHKPGDGSTYDGTKKRGIGLSFHHTWNASWQELRRGPIQAIVRVNPDGTVYLEAPTVETGPGSSSCCVFTCAETLGIRTEDVHWISTVDTETSVKDQVQTDSAVSHILPEAIHTAALDAKRQVLGLAAPELGVMPEELDINDGRIYVKAAPQKAMTIKELFWKRDLFWGGDLVPVLSSVSMALPDEVTGNPYMAAFAEVEVDTETGQVEVLKLVVLGDCGTVMHASGAEAQQIGGQCIGLGEALTEEIIYDETTGVPLNLNFIDYKVPTMADFPDIEPVLMEVWKGAGEYGACGIGESAPCCTPRAIANAVYNAIGVRIDDNPITPDKILKALGKI
jgi:xanthine dehydrogenase molybdenum-binding subunit